MDHYREITVISITEQGKFAIGPRKSDFSNCGPVLSDVPWLNTSTERREAVSNRVQPREEDIVNGCSVSATRSGFKVEPEPAFVKELDELNRVALLHHRKSCSVLAGAVRLSSFRYGFISKRSQTCSASLAVSTIAERYLRLVQTMENFLGILGKWGAKVKPMSSRWRHVEPFRLNTTKNKIRN